MTPRPGPGRFFCTSPISPVVIFPLCRRLARLIFPPMSFDPKRLDDNHLTRLRWLPYAICAFITALIAIPILNNLSNWGVRDWDLFTTLHASAVRSLLDYHQFPFWNPYIGGGNILFAHPEVPVLNPLFGLLLIFGPLYGLKLQILVIYFFGLLGGYKLARQIGTGVWGSYITAIAFMLSSFLSGHITAGHIPFHYFAVFPWLVFFYKKSLERPIHIISAAACVAFVILGSGAAVPFLFSLFFLFLVSLCDALLSRSIRPPLFAIAAGLGGILLAAVKFFPMYDYLSRHPWVPEQTVQVTPLWILPSMFFHYNQSIFADHIAGSYVWGWHEYSAYIGPFVFILALAALIYRFRDHWPYLALTFLSLILVCGSFFPPFSPWDLLHRLPGFSSIRVPSRFALLAIFAFSLLAGKGFDLISHRFGSRRNLYALGLVLIILGTHLAVVLPQLNEAFKRPPETVSANADFKQIDGNPNRMYAAFLSNRGTIKAAWLSAYREGRGIISPDGATQEWYSPNDRVTVAARRFTPNRISFDLQSATGGQLIISQGYDPGWHRADSKEVKASFDLVSLDINAGERQVEVYYFPDYFIPGLIVSILSILAALGAVILWKKR
jgi:hypothetical protein